MKDSGVEWLGDIPEGWQVKPHWAFTKEKKVPVGNLHSELTLLSLTKQGVIIRDLEAGGKFPSNFEGYQQVASNDLVLCLFDIEETPRTVGLAPTEGMITSAYTLMRVTSINPHFLEWYLIGMDNEKRFKPFYSGLRNTLQKPIFGSIRFAVPPPGEQAQIVDYLDQETSQIDALISKKEQLIEKLLERRQALITQVVTRGLDPNVPIKDSGIEWLGQVPSTWPLGKLSYYAAVKLGKMLDKSESEGSELLPYLSAISIQNETLQIKTDKQMWASIGDQKSLNLAKDDLLVVEGGMAGMTAHLQANLPGIIFQNSINRVRIQKDKFQTRFVFYWLNYLRNLGVVESVCNQATIMHLTKEKLEALEILRPPKAIQDQIVSYLDKETSQIDILVEKTRTAIELLKERRQALITQVVTGKIDVRGFDGGNS
jgi:type I restriction enzyme S subunit